MKRKTRREWLLDIKDPRIRRKALNYATEEHLNEECGSFALALGGAFIWSETEEGRLFWSSFHKKYDTYMQKYSKIEDNYEI